jgi:hypothetical protein
MQQVRRKNPYLGPIIIVGILSILLLILIVAMSVFLVTRRANAGPASRSNPLIGPNPVARLDVGQVDPALALTSLGGVSEADVIATAIDKSRPEVALAALLFEPNLTSKESAGGFLQLAAAYAKNGNKDKAVFSYEMAGTIATLAPDLADTVRADLFLQGGEGLIELNEATLAMFYLDQAYIIALRGPTLQAAHRRAILERLQKDYLALDERELARQSLSLSANPPNAFAATERKMVLPKSQPIPLTSSIQEAEAKRWQAAQELTANLLAREGDVSQTFVEALGQALITEDQLRLPFYESEFEKTSQLSKKIDITMAQISWLSIKHRLARQAYGLSIVPEWEGQVDQIRTELTKKYETLFALYADLGVALPEASQIDRATEERLRYEILAGELGRYPNYPEEQRKNQLLDATNQLIATQPAIRIFVSVIKINNQDMYTLISSEQSKQ